MVTIQCEAASTPNHQSINTQANIFNIPKMDEKHPEKLETVTKVNQPHNDLTPN